MDKKTHKLKSGIITAKGIAKEPRKRNGPYIRVATYNVHFGRRPARIAEAISANENLNRADIILLQEIESHERERRPRAEIMAEVLNMHYVYAPARKKFKGTHGLAILSRYPIVDSNIIPLKFFRLFMRARDRIALDALIDIEGEQLRVINVHLDTTLNAHERLSQIEPAIIKALENEEEKTIIGGDFNTLPLHFYRRILPAFIHDQKKVVDEYFLKHNFRTQIEEVEYTMRRGYVKLNLDSIYVRGTEAIKFGVEKEINVSDHQPLWADIAI